MTASRPTTLALRILAALTLAWALPATGAAPQGFVTRPAGPVGIYPLKPGFYVADGADCKSPANAALLHYNGRGLSGAHSSACKASVRSRRGRIYTVVQSCIDSGSGPAPRSKESQQITVHDTARFTQTIAGRATSYHYCPAISLPPDLRKALQP